MRFTIIVLVLIFTLVSGSCFAVPLTVPTNKHNLSFGSSNIVKASSDTRICVFCHTPHGSTSQSPLWNRQDPATASFPLYSSGTLNIDDAGIVADSLYTANPATYPNGATRMCLSCHDGVSAVGAVVSGSNIATTFNTMNAAGGAGVVDLSTSHPVSFVYNGIVMGLINTAEGGTNYQLPTAVPLDSADRMQCTTCHDPHDDTRTGSYNLPFWRKYTGVEAADYDSTCQDCHLGADWGGVWGGAPPLTPSIH